LGQRSLKALAGVHEVAFVAKQLSCELAHTFTVLGSPLKIMLGPACEPMLTFSDSTTFPPLPDCR
jgi:hypothetical protein